MGLIYHFGTRDYPPNKVKQDLATKEIEQRLKQEIEKQKLNETLCMTRPEPETGENSMGKSNCNTLKLVTGKPFGITKIGARIISIITVGGHEATRNLSGPSDQTVMHIDVYLDVLFRNFEENNLCMWRILCWCGNCNPPGKITNL